jgi:CHAT domain-containing protein
MRSVLLHPHLLVLLLFFGIKGFAQEKVLQRKLDSLKTKDNLTDWVYDRIDYATFTTQTNLSFLLATQPWRKAKTADEHNALLSLLNNKGYYQLLSGNILGSIDSYEAGYRYYLKNKVANYEIVEYTIKPLSNNYTRLGDYERALYLQQLALNFLIQTKDQPENVAAVYSNMAISYRAMNKLNEAESSIKKGLKLVKPHTKAYIMLNNILADISNDKGDYLTAAKLIESNIVKQKNSNTDNAYWLMGAYTTAGTAYFNLKNAAKADEYLNKAVQLISTNFKGTRLREQANIYTLKGKVKLLRQQPLLAISDFKKTLSILKVNSPAGNPIVSKIYGDNKLIEVFEQMANSYLQLKKPDEAFNYIKLSLFSADKIRNEFVDDQTKERLQADLKYLTEKAIDIAHQRYLSTKNKDLLQTILELAEHSKARTLFDQIKRNQQSLIANRKDSLFIKKQAFERAIIYNEKQELESKDQFTNKNTDSLKFYLALVNKQIKQKYAQFNFENDLNVEKLLAILPKGRVIEYFVGKESIYLIDIKDGKLNQVIKLPNSQSIKSVVKTFTQLYFTNGPSAMLNAPKAFYLASYQIYQQLLAPISFAKGEKIIIIPDEVLGYLSFDGLLTDGNYKPNIATWPFLIKKNTTTYAFSLQTLSLKKQVNNDKKFTGLFITHQNNNKPLKAVQDEADAIEKKLNGKFVFNDKVNKERFNIAFEESTVLHIGTHAYLSGKNQQPTLSFDKEQLFLFELDAKKQAPALVILSACRTADGLLANGEGIISLSRGFNALGTPATIAGLWNVNDVAASVITSNFYQHLLDGKSSGEALHQAKLDWLNTNHNSDALHLPYYWDSLIYMGNDQHIELKSATNWWWIIGIGTVLLLIFSAYFFLNKQKR